MMEKIKAGRLCKMYLTWFGPLPWDVKDPDVKGELEDFIKPVPDEKMRELFERVAKMDIKKPRLREFHSAWKSMEAKRITAEKNARELEEEKKRKEDFAKRKAECPDPGPCTVCRSKRIFMGNRWECSSLRCRHDK